MRTVKKQLVAGVAILIVGLAVLALAPGGSAGGGKYEAPGAVSQMNTTTPFVKAKEYNGKSYIFYNTPDSGKMFLQLMDKQKEGKKYQTPFNVHDGIEEREARFSFIKTNKLYTFSKPAEKVKNEYKPYPTFYQFIYGFNEGSWNTTGEKIVIHSKDYVRYRLSWANFFTAPTNGHLLLLGGVEGAGLHTKELWEFNKKKWNMVYRKQAPVKEVDYNNYDFWWNSSIVRKEDEIYQLFIFIAEDYSQYKTFLGVSADRGRNWNYHLIKDFITREYSSKDVISNGSVHPRIAIHGDKIAATVSYRDFGDDKSEDITVLATSSLNNLNKWKIVRKEGFSTYSTMGLRTGFGFGEGGEAKVVGAVNTNSGIEIRTMGSGGSVKKYSVGLSGEKALGVATVIDGVAGDEGYSDGVPFLLLTGDKQSGEGGKVRLGTLPLDYSESSPEGSSPLKYLAYALIAAGGIVSATSIRKGESEEEE